MTSGVGSGHIIVSDLNLDGVTEVVSCDSVYAFALNRTAYGDYSPTWYSYGIPCNWVAAGDRDGDGIQEIYVGTLGSNSKVSIFRGDTFEQVGTFFLQDGGSLADLAIADVDSDGSQEIVVVHADATLVYDAHTFELEWRAVDKGGSQVAIGDVDGDPEPEIVVNDNPAHVLSAVTRTEEWSYPGGFGINMGVGDIDDDGIDEIVYGKASSDIYAIEGDSQAVKWHFESPSYPYQVAVADTDGDGVDEVLVGDEHGVTGYLGGDGTELWSIHDPLRGIMGIGVGDADNDGVNEVVWGSGSATSQVDRLYIGDWLTESVEWGSDGLIGPLHVDAADVDKDGQVEIIMASFSTDLAGGTLRIYDGQTYEPEWSTPISNEYYNISHLAVGQLDADPALEIMVAGINWYRTRVKVYDGITHAVQWTSAELADDAPRALLVMNLDADPVEEFVIGLADKRVQVFNGATPLIQWDSGTLDGNIQDVSAGDLDGDLVLELAILTDQSFYIFEAGTWTEKLHQALIDGQALTVANGDLSGAGELLVISGSSGSGHQIQAWDGLSYELLWQRSLGIGFVNGIAATDLDGDGDQEFVVVGTPLLINSQISTTYWVEYQNDDSWSGMKEMAQADLDGDGQGELIFAGYACIRVGQIILSPLTIYAHYFPILMRNQ
jgi:hypothetical protein